MVTRSEFEAYFSRALEEAAGLADVQLGYSVPRRFTVLLHGAGHSGVLMAPTSAIEALYLSEDRFWRIIDFSVRQVSPTMTTVFVRASSHPPSKWDQTWNTPPGTGPFKQVGPHIPIRVVAE